MQVFTFSVWGDTVSSYRDCMHVWETWMAFDEVTLASTRLFSNGTRSRFYSSSTAFVRMLCRTLYKLCMLRIEEVNEQRKEVHAVDMYSTYSRQATLLEHTKRAAYQLSQGHCLFRLLIYLLLCTDFSKIINYINFIVHLVTENWHSKLNCRLILKNK